MFSLYAGVDFGKNWKKKILKTLWSYFQMTQASFVYSEIKLSMK